MGMKKRRTDYQHDGSVFLSQHHNQLQDANEQDEERDIPSPHLLDNDSDQPLPFLAFLPPS